MRPRPYAHAPKTKPNLEPKPKPGYSTNKISSIVSSIKYKICRQSRNKYLARVHRTIRVPHSDFLSELFWLQFLEPKSTINVNFGSISLQGFRYSEQSTWFWLQKWSRKAFLWKMVNFQKLAFETQASFRRHLIDFFNAIPRSQPNLYLLSSSVLSS